MRLMFIVTKRFGRSETRLQEFSEIKAAEDFIFEKLREDKRFKIVATYGLYEGMDFIREYSQQEIPETAGSSSANSGAGQPGSSQTFSPSPFNTAPRPAGLPHSSFKDEDKKEK